MGQHSAGICQVSITQISQAVHQTYLCIHVFLCVCVNVGTLCLYPFDLSEFV